MKAQYEAGDCIKITKTGTSPFDSVTVIAIVDTCLGTRDTIFINGDTLVNGSVVFEAPSDSSITFRYAKGRRLWMMQIDTTAADTVIFRGWTFVTPQRFDTTYTRVFAPDTIQFFGQTSSGGDGDTTFIDLRDTPATYTGSSGKLVAVKAGEDGLEFIDPPAATQRIIGYSHYLGTPIDSTADYIWLVGYNGVILGHEYSITGDTIQYYWMLDWDWIKDSVTVWTAGSGGGGASTFLDLTDTPSGYTGKAGQVPIVNPGETGIEFGSPPIDGTLQNAVVVWDTTGVSVDSTAKVIRLEWYRPTQIAAWPSSTADTSELSGRMRYGMVKYRIYLATPTGTRRANGAPGWLLQIVFDSTNGCWPAGSLTYNAFTWALTAFAGAASSQRNTTWAFGNAPFYGGQLSAGTQYGYATSSIYRAIGFIGATGQIFGTPWGSINGRPHQYWTNYWITNQSTTTAEFAGWVDVEIHYGMDHGASSTWGARIQSIRWMNMSY